MNAVAQPRNLAARLVFPEQMRRPLSLLLCLAAAAGAAAPAALAADASTGAGEARAGVWARLSACTTGAQPSARAATFSASAPLGATARRLAIRFELQQRLPGAGFAPVQVPGWDGWERSAAGRSRLTVHKRVQDLLAPASYRAVVRLRWLARGGKVLREARRTTAVCEQPDPRPDLRLGPIDLSGADQDRARYDVLVRNAGESTAAVFGVVIVIGGTAYGPASVGPLAPGLSERATIVAPRCQPGSSITISVDSGGAVDEASEDDNVVTRPCPAA